MCTVFMKHEIPIRASVDGIKMQSANEPNYRRYRYLYVMCSQKPSTDTYTTSRVGVPLLGLKYSVNEVDITYN